MKKNNLFKYIFRVQCEHRSAVVCRRLWIMMVACFFIFHTIAQPASDLYRVILISNLDDVKPDARVVDGLIDHMADIYEPFSLVINGDFSNEMAMLSVERLVNWIQTRPECRIILNQGDRDWSNSGPEGWESIRKLEKRISKLKCPNLIWANSKGCSSPEIITLDNHVQFIAINTQWINQPYVKPTAETGDCKISEVDEFYEELEDLIDEHSDQNILIAGHYPIRSNGPYGGKFPISDWLFPIPIVSGFSTSYKKNVGGPKEINNERFVDFAEEMLDIILARHSLIYASGHEKNFEIQSHGDNYLINSGSFGKVSNVAHSRFTVAKAKYIGFNELIYIPTGEVKSEFWRWDEQSKFIKNDDRILFQAPCENPIVNVPVNERFIPCSVELPILDKMLFEHQDSVLTAANPNYKAGQTTKLFLGEHYRKSWITPVKVAQLNLDTEQGGLTPMATGGGRQTQSLKFMTKAGEQYVFRSVDKDPTKSLEYDLRNTVLDILLQDQTTTQHPYGALTVPSWLDKLGILHATPKLFVMPDDPKLGPWRRKFGGMFGMLEVTPTDNAQKLFADADDLKRSVRMFRKLYQDRDYKIAKDEFIRARVLDIYLGDWGRHEDNWKWAEYDGKNETIFRPIPRDRDHLFSKWDGFLPWLADREWAKASGENFSDDIHDMRSLTWQNRHMDRFLLSEMDRADWKQAAMDVKAIATEEQIRTSIHRMPAKNVDLNQSEIIDRLIHRSDRILEFADRYYDLLAKEVDVVGSNKHELFNVVRKQDGSVQVSMYKLKKGDQADQYYNRIFYPEETKEIRLFGLGGRDKFNISGDVDKSIKIRVVPGLDRDSIVDESSVRKGSKSTRLYIDPYEDDYVAESKEVKYHRHAEASAYDYDRKAFHYNTYFPLLYVFFSTDRGLDFGGLVTFTNHKYGKADFSSRHRIKTRVSTNGNLSIKYEPRWNNVIGSCDIVGQVEYEKNKNFNYFFGKGQLPKYDETLLNDQFYSLKYSTIGAGVGISKEFWRNAEVSAIFTGYYNSKQRRDSTIALSTPEVRGLESGFNTQLELLLDLDLRDRNDLPSSGYRFFAESKIGTDVQSEEGSFLSGVAHVEMFHTFHPFTLGLRFGGAINEGDVPYFLLQYLGQNTYLKGFRQNRFLGDEHIFANSELRLQLVDTKKAFIPMQFGLKFYLDAGKIFIDELPHSELKWQFGYGGGLYFVPYKERLTINLTAGFSTEESLLVQFKLGKPF